MANSISERPDVTFVIPIYNEEDVLPQLFTRLAGVLAKIDGTTEVIFVNDGSVDRSLGILHEKAKDATYKVLSLSRNFGHQIAITAGIDKAKGNAIIIMDADLQDPPEVALEMLERWREGYHVVAARRLSRVGETLFKRASASLFYRILKKMTPVDIPADVGDFRLIDRKVAEALRSMPEQDRYFRGMVSWVGFRQTQVSYERQERAAGETKYPLSAMFKLAVNGIIGFSDLPLRMALWCGSLVSLISFGAGLFVFIGWLVGGETVPGWASTILLLSFLSGVQLLTLGVIGLYVGRTYNESKRRPLYFIETSHSLDESDPPAITKAKPATKPATAKPRRKLRAK